jgi:hypothetical protein
MFGKNLHLDNLFPTRLRCRLPRPRWRKVSKIIEIRTCQGVEKYLLRSDGSLCPWRLVEDLAITISDMGLGSARMGRAETGTRRPRFDASMERRRDSDVGSVEGWRNAE